MNKIITSIIVSASMFSLSYASDMKIGIVNPVKIYQEVPQGLNTIQKLHATYQPKMQGLQTEQKSLMAKIEKLEQNAPTMATSDLQEAKSKINKERNNFKAKAKKIHDEEANKEHTLASQFQASFNKAIQKVAVNGSYDMILSSQAVAYAKNDNDVTNNIISIMKKDS